MNTLLRDTIIPQYELKYNSNREQGVVSGYIKRKCVVKYSHNNQVVEDEYATLSRAYSVIPQHIAEPYYMRRCNDIVTKYRSSQNNKQLPSNVSFCSNSPNSTDTTFIVMQYIQNVSSNRFIDALSNYHKASILFQIIIIVLVLFIQTKIEYYDLHMKNILIEHTGTNVIEEYDIFRNGSSILHIPVYQYRVYLSDFDKIRNCVNIPIRQCERDIVRVIHNICYNFYRDTNIKIMYILKTTSIHSILYFLKLSTSEYIEYDTTSNDLSLFSPI